MDPCFLKVIILSPSTFYMVHSVVASIPIAILESYDIMILLIQNNIEFWIPDLVVS
jgi:hypothetical protein